MFEGKKIVPLRTNYRILIRDDLAFVEKNIGTG